MSGQPTVPRRIDGHVHLIGDGSAGDGCWLRLDSVRMRWQGRFLMRAAGLPSTALHTGLDAVFRRHLCEQIETSSLDAVLLLAQEIPYDTQGRALPEKAVFYASNEAVLHLASEHSGRILPAVSIHPARGDALDELERCAEAGARVMKLLPNCQNVDCNRSEYRAFWTRMSELRMIFLAHTGGELSLPVFDANYADPEILRTPLEAGVVCIAAHGAGRSAFIDPDYTESLFSMMDTYPHLYTDNSALSSLNRAGTARALLNSRHLNRVIHGSDFPIPVMPLGPRLRGLIDGSAARAAKIERNVLERDVLLKTAMRFPSESFTRLDRLLQAS